MPGAATALVFPRPSLRVVLFDSRMDLLFAGVKDVVRH